MASAAGSSVNESAKRVEYLHCSLGFERKLSVSFKSLLYVEHVGGRQVRCGGIERGWKPPDEALCHKKSHISLSRLNFVSGSHSAAKHVVIKSSKVVPVR